MKAVFVENRLLCPIPHFYVNERHVQWNPNIELRYNKDPGITNDIVQPSYSKMYGKEPRYNEPPFKRTDSPSPLPLGGPLYHQLRKAGIWFP